MFEASSRENGIVAIIYSLKSRGYNDFKVNKSIKYIWVASVVSLWVSYKVRESCLTQ